MESLSGWAQGWSAFVPAGPSASRLWLTQVKMCRKYTLYSRFGRRYKNHKLCPSPQIPPPTSPPSPLTALNLRALRTWRGVGMMLTLTSTRVHCPTFNLQATLPPSQSFLFQTESRTLAKPPTAPTQHLYGLGTSGPLTRKKLGLPFLTGVLGVLMGSWTWGSTVVHFS